MKLSEQGSNELCARLNGVEVPTSSTVFLSNECQSPVPNAKCSVSEENNIFDEVTKRFQLEDFTRFSQSHLWKLMTAFYESQGVASWAEGIVPHFITSNSFIAKRYAQLLIAYFSDGSKQILNKEEPLYIVELGAGSGKFSFYLLQTLSEMEDCLDFPLSKIRYVMTDFTEKNVNYWREHVALQPFVKRGLVDFAIFDATKDTELQLRISCTTVKPGELINPICIIANYLFDTLHHDLFQIDQSCIKEGLISVGSSRDIELNPLDPEIITRLDNQFKYEIARPEAGKRDISSAIMEWYLRYFTQKSCPATILIPIGALDVLERLNALSSGKALILSADKGSTCPDHFRGLNDPHIAVHGSFSVMVNYHAIGIYAALLGGFAIHSPQEEASLTVSIFVLPQRSSDFNFCTTILLSEELDHLNAHRKAAFPKLKAAFNEWITAFGPNDFFVIQKALKEEVNLRSVKSVLALLKLSNWDPDVFYKYRDVLLESSPASSSKMKSDVRAGISHLWKKYYALDKEKDIAFELGRLCYGMQDYDLALNFYRASIQELGKHHVTSHNMGLCYYNKHQLDLAAERFGEAHELNASYQKAITWLERVRKEQTAVRDK
uniref:type II protein arginine methyltransferase n=1 Tax=Albugo laibachii Nc14 TaxID=890382 RepID=F0VYL0_9STRA|nr:conserved hypothetical protein [Albugo laibachii Nc14]|eukprot:CCA13874.1 conserved hypothetical protein [Albugo laibachii Nc14]